MQAIISDIHGNLEALEAVLKDIKTKNIQDIICLGDVIGYGPNPRECLKIAQQFKFCLRGNHEEAVLYLGIDFHDGAVKAINWTKEILNSPSSEGSGRNSCSGGSRRRMVTGSPSISLNISRKSDLWKGRSSAKTCRRSSSPSANQGSVRRDSGVVRQDGEVSRRVPRGTLCGLDTGHS